MNNQIIKTSAVIIGNAKTQLCVPVSYVPWVDNWQLVIVENRLNFQKTMYIQQ